MEFHTFSLSNGLRVIFKRTNRPVSHCGIVINAGSRDEEAGQEGLAHYIEHCIFKGTKKRKTYHILSRLDNVGGEINAYTGKEDTWIYGSFLNEYLDRSLELISDIVLNSTFPQKEIEKEKDVIIDEISSYKDSPGEQIFDDFEELIFENHPLGNPVLGSEESVAKLSRDHILDFIEKNYSSETMVLSVLGDYTLAKVKKLAEKYFESVKRSNTKKEKREEFKIYKPSDIEIEMDTHQVHYIAGGIGYSSADERRTPLHLMNNYLGGPAMNSLLNLEVREKHGIAYNIESSYQPYSDTGVFEIYLGTDKKMFEKSKKLVDKQLKKLRENKLGVNQLQTAKNQVLGQIALAQESGVGTMMGLGTSYLFYDRVDTLSEVFARINKVTAEDVLAVANEVLDTSTFSSITYL
ncbi:MAG: pitrilysin family protein [Flavobacteriales bacterium]|jgi:predicted Zn-dependent peptidase|tara:strand:+ start:1061 stop:2284 length:1224 start_codon:yes stop_codon:yes gene_type:complete